MLDEQNTIKDLLIPLDIQEHATIQRWRYMKEKRKEELKNLKHNQSTLAQQISDKIFYDNQEQKLSNAYARDGIKHETILQLLEFRQEQDRRNLARDINEFRRTYQQAQNTRNRSIENNHSQFSLGSCLFFEGEDHNKKNREKQQKEQMNRWIIEQCRQKDEAIKQQQISDQDYDYNQLIIAERIKNLELTQIILRRQLENDIQEFNKAFADQKRCERHTST